MRGIEARVDESFCRCTSTAKNERSFDPAKIAVVELREPGGARLIPGSDRRLKRAQPAHHLLAATPEASPRQVTGLAVDRRRARRARVDVEAQPMSSFQPRPDLPSLGVSRSPSPARQPPDQRKRPGPPQAPADLRRAKGSSRSGGRDHGAPTLLLVGKMSEATSFDLDLPWGNLIGIR